LYAVPLHAADVFTDRPDYPPGDTAIITGTGFWPDEVVTVQVTHLDGETPQNEAYEPWDVMTNGYGIFDAYWVIPEDALGEVLLLTAEGQSSGLRATTTFADNATVLVWGGAIPDTMCPNNGFDFCAILYEQCIGGTYSPLPNRPLYFFINVGNCGVNVGQDADDTVYTDADGIACAHLTLPSDTGQYTIRVKFLGEPKPGPGDSANSACNPGAKVNLSASNVCHAFILDSAACNEPPTTTCPGDTTVFLCELGEICIPGFSCFDPDANLLSCDVSLGTLSNDTVCFTPTGPGVYTIQLVATDTFGAADTCETNVTVALNSPPVADCPGDTSVFACDASQVCIPGFTASDPDNNIASVTAPGYTLNGDTICFIPEAGVKTITYIVTDSCGAADTCVTQVTITMNSAPVCNLPSNGSYFVCGDTTFNFPVSATDADNNLIGCTKISGIGTLTAGVWTFTTSGSGVYSATFECEDSCGAKCSGTVNITVTYNSAPVITCPADVTIECDESSDPTNTGYATATDDHDPSPIIDYTDSEVAGACPQEKVITRTWTATDECAAISQCQQTITVVDTTAPVITCPADTTIECDESTDPSSTGYATATDNCDPNPAIAYTDQTSGNVITRTWTATDACGNVDSCQQT
jgi:hypothetical protein